MEAREEATAPLSITLENRLEERVEVHSTATNWVSFRETRVS